MPAESNSAADKSWSNLDVSNRSILRVQQLANELAADLKKLQIADHAGKDIHIVNALFAARDAKHSVEDQKLWYNFRLCAQPQDFKELGLWLKSHSRIQPFEALFSAARSEERTTRANFDKFKEAFEMDDWRGTFDQFIIALAVIPYRGVLLTLFEAVFGMTPKRQSDEPPIEHLPAAPNPPSQCAFFSGSLDAMSFHQFDGFNWRVESPLLKQAQAQFCLLPGLLSDNVQTETLRNLFRIILPFTRGEKVSEKYGPESPYPSEPGFESNSAEGSASAAHGHQTSLSGFVSPVYDHFERDSLSGSFVGWLVVFTKETGTGPTMGSQQVQLSWKVYSEILLPRFARDVREAHMYDLVEEYADSQSPAQPEDHFRQHLHHLTGYKSAQSGARRQPGDTPCAKLEIPFDPPLDSFSMDVEPLWDTRAKSAFPPHLKRMLKTFFEDLQLVHSQRRTGQLRGSLDTTHDYSKDIGSACLRMKEFDKTLIQGRKAILEHSRRLAELPGPAPAIGEEIVRELNRFQAPRMEWIAGVRFTHAHLQVQTTGAITGEPAECVAMVETGTLRSVYDLVRNLVWLPLHYAGYKELEQSLQAAQSPEINNPLTWAALFRYDMRPTEATKPFHEKLGRRIIQIIREQNIPGTDFLKRFPAPEINPGSLDFDAPLLWGQGEKEGSRRWSPIERLLPLMVFSLRFAFQCAWARTLLADTSGGREPILLSASRPDDRTCRIEFAVSPPDPGHQGRLERIPYYLEWRQQMSHYAGCTYPWKDAGTNSVTLNPVTGRLTLALTATI